MDAPTTVHHVHSYERPARSVRLRLERNSRGYTWEVSAEGETVDEALALVRDADARLRREYGQGDQA